MYNIFPYLIAIVAYGAPLSAAPLTVDDAVRFARQHSPQFAVARYDAQIAKAQTDRDRPVARPIVTAQALSTVQGPRATFPRAGDGDATVLPETYSKIEINIDQPVYRAGMGAARIRYAAQTRANALELSRAENDAILEVRRAYYYVYTAETMAQVARDGLDLARKHLDLTKLMLQAGNASERDVMASDADLAEAEQGASKADNGVAMARANMNRLMGRSPDTDFSLAPMPSHPVIPDEAMDGIAQALARRPELLALQEGIVAARAGISLAAAQDSPSLSARATAVQQTASAFVRDTYAAASLVLTWTPFDGGKSRSDMAEAGAQTAKLAAQLEEAKLGIRVEVEKAWRDMREAGARIAAADRQVKSAEKAHEISELRYETRAATQLEVSGALFAVAKARANQAQAVNDLQIAVAEYQHAIGADVISAGDKRVQIYR